MNVSQFKATLDEINKSSWGFGNEILYLMAGDPNDLKDEKKLAGSIWLIGRAYAASPQRRSYGTDASTEEQIWPVKTQNDGREGFFDDIAETMQSLVKKDSAIQELINDQSAYEYKMSESDYKKLIKSILAVLKFNLILSGALEKFDEVPEGRQIYCSNHISFSSKYLHFYFPNNVFIIDSFARDGGKSLFNGKGKSRAFYNPPKENDDIFDETVYEKFRKIDLSTIKDEIIESKEIKDILELYNKRARDDKNSQDNTVSDYIEHCIRSYLLGCFIKDKNINPINLIKYDKQTVISSMPRLTDAVFLNIKTPISTKEKEHLESLDKKYYKAQS